MRSRLDLAPVSSSSGSSTARFLPSRQARMSSSEVFFMAHPERGIALQRQDILMGIADAIFKGKGGEIYPSEDPENLGVFAEEIRKSAESGDKGK